MSGWPTFDGPPYQQLRDPEQQTQSQQQQQQQQLQQQQLQQQQQQQQQLQQQAFLQHLYQGHHPQHPFYMHHATPAATAQASMPWQGMSGPGGPVPAMFMPPHQQWQQYPHSAQQALQQQQQQQQQFARHLQQAQNPYSHQQEQLAHPNSNQQQQQQHSPKEQRQQQYEEQPAAAHALTSSTQGHNSSKKELQRKKAPSTREEVASAGAAAAHYAGRSTSRGHVHNVSHEPRKNRPNIRSSRDDDDTTPRASSHHARNLSRPHRHSASRGSHGCRTKQKQLQGQPHSPSATHNLVPVLHGGADIVAGASLAGDLAPPSHGMQKGPSTAPEAPVESRLGAALLPQPGALQQQLARRQANMQEPDAQQAGQRQATDPNADNQGGHTAYDTQARQQHQHQQSADAPAAPAAMPQMPGYQPMYTPTMAAMPGLPGAGGGAAYVQPHSVLHQQGYPHHAGMQWPMAAAPNMTMQAHQGMQAAAAAGFQGPPGAAHPAYPYSSLLDMTPAGDEQPSRPRGRPRGAAMSLTGVRLRNRMKSQRYRDKKKVEFDEVQDNVHRLHDRAWGLYTRVCALLRASAPETTGTADSDNNNEFDSEPPSKKPKGTRKQGSTTAAMGGGPAHHLIRRLRSVEADFGYILGAKFQSPFIRKSYTDEAFQRDVVAENLTFRTPQLRSREKNRRSSRFYREQRKREEAAWEQRNRQLDKCVERLQQILAEAGQLWGNEMGVDAEPQRQGTAASRTGETQATVAELEEQHQQRDNDHDETGNDLHAEEEEEGEAGGEEEEDEEEEEEEEDDEEEEEEEGLQ